MRFKPFRMFAQLSAFLVRFRGLEFVWVFLGQFALLFLHFSLRIYIQMLNIAPQEVSLHVMVADNDNKFKAPKGRLLYFMASFDLLHLLFPLPSSHPIQWKIFKHPLHCNEQLQKRFNGREGKEVEINSN